MEKNVLRNRNNVPISVEHSLVEPSLQNFKALCKVDYKLLF